ncbi:hypothetical protein F4780DRAFT_224254 [Xylariomycetidae sp. FL0641]|nr:hypothetical protein F4780DRAFT_224254 [Xylariomycetidae sp. FL0641]
MRPLSAEPSSASSSAAADPSVSAAASHPHTRPLPPDSPAATTAGAVGVPSHHRYSVSGASSAGAHHKRGHSFDGQSPVSNAESTQAGADNASGGAEDQRKKRRTGPGSRGVANLTPEQLAKKRANDREAQRAIRERTKNQIETLEKRIRDLTSQQPYQDLQAVIRQKEAVEAENAEIKARLASIMSMIQPLISNQQAEAAYASPVPTFTPGHSAQPPPSAHSAQNASTPASAASPLSAVESSWHGQVNAQPSPKYTQVKQLNQQRYDLVHNLQLGGGEHLKLDFLLDPSQRVNRIQAGPNGAQDTPAYHHLPMKHDWNGAQFPTHAPTRTNSAMSGGSQPQQYRIDYAPDHSSQSPSGPWSSMPHASIKNCEPTCPLDSLLLDFLHERRERAAEGVPTQEIIGPRYPSVSSLLNPSNSVYSHPLSKVFTDILATFPGICTLPERVATLYIMFLVMRWQISPTQENWELLPPWMRPGPAQLYTPHPAWVDHLPFPQMREKIAREYHTGTYPFDNFFIPFTTTISLNWQYEDTDALLQSPDGADLLINPVFERHLRRLDNWSLGDAFDLALPALRGTYHLKHDGSGGPDSGAASARHGSVDERYGGAGQ